MKIKNFLWALPLSVLISCSEDVPNSDTLAADIKKNETVMRQNRMQLDTNLALKTIEMYTRFQRLYPQDSLSAEFLFRAADLSKGIGRFEQAIQLLSSIPLAYPNYKNAPICLFLQGYIYQTSLNSYSMADGKYREFLKRYPYHPLASDARNLMAQMTMTDEEIMNRLKSGKSLKE